ncbi:MULTISPECIES: branched-chain amino acid transaminase [Herpetosiphon]|uniref:branched-chain amino acid transaminase n=1 Tax=Herpetosiphon TaxID=64 RepID=UPI00195CE72A|nr:branched-chain amino acid transaminase [Herpetosiphon giganteus]MBM7844257.1 branched-chain amino acid aminotransferase [Herpetosiphon giganteus]
MSTNRFAFFKGEIVPIADAKVSVMNHALNYGTGCFEGIRAYWNEADEQLYVFHLQAHYERLLRSCKVLQIRLPYTVEQLVETTLELLRREEFRSDVYIRPLAYKSFEGIGVRLHDISDDFTIWAIPFGKYIEKEAGLKVGISSWRRIDDNAIPARLKATGSYVNSALVKSEAMQNGFDEGIVLTQDGHVCEGSAENIYVVRNGVLYTPGITDNILEGITRHVIKQLATEELGLQVVERTIDRTELYAADEIFFCGTGVEVTPVVEVDHRAVGNGEIGPIFTQLRSLYYAATHGQDAKRREWCSPVYSSVLA